MVHSVMDKWKRNANFDTNFEISKLNKAMMQVQNPFNYRLKEKPESKAAEISFTACCKKWPNKMKF